MTKTIGWKTLSGKSVEITMTHESIMMDDISYADGCNINLGRTPYQNGEVTISIDGIEATSFSLDEYTKAELISGMTLKHNPQHAGKYQIKKTMLMTTKENADLYNQAVAEVIEGGKSDEYKAFEAAEATKAAAQEIAWANSIIDKAAKQGRLYTAAEIKIMAANYNDLYNEGGDGFVPTWVSQEQYDKARRIINR